MPVDMENSASCQWKHPRKTGYRYPHPADPRSGASGLCFFHWDDFDKPAEETGDRLRKILSGPGSEALDFQGFIFPHRMAFKDLFTSSLSKPVDLSHAKFGEGTKFNWARLIGQGTRFNSATFGERANFDEVVFGERASFDKAKFGERASFNRATFRDGASFGWAAFSGEASFDWATFGDRAWFGWAAFGGEASFCGATFGDRARFNWAAFSGGANFDEAAFGGEASFDWATFGEGARFLSATFGDGVTFSMTAFHGDASFPSAKFKGRCAFAGRSPTPKDQKEYLVFPSSGEVDFRNVLIEEPRKFQFRHVDLSRVSFLETDLRGVDFLDCRWAKWKGRKKGRTVLHDEQAHCRTEGPSGTLEANLRLTQSLYQQLKRNFEENRDFAQAGEFHFGEMEMRRLQEKKFWRWGCGLLNIYRLASGYGEYHRRAFWVFFGIVLLFTLAFAFSPNAIGQKKDQNFAGLPGVFEVSGNREKAGRVWDSFVYSFRAASLLRALPSTPGAEIYPASRWGVALTALLSVIGPVQLALFFLALRRHVRR